MAAVRRGERLHIFSHRISGGYNPALVRETHMCARLTVETIYLLLKTVKLNQGGNQGRTSERPSLSRDVSVSKHRQSTLRPELLSYSFRSVLIAFGYAKAAVDWTLKNGPRSEKGKMEIFNEEVTRGIRTANSASVRVFSGRFGRLAAPAAFRSERPKSERRRSQDPAAIVPRIVVETIVIALIVVAAIDLVLPVTRN
jgi:hypothetical protein